MLSVFFLLKYFQYVSVSISIRSLICKAHWTDTTWVWAEGTRPASSYLFHDWPTNCQQNTGCTIYWTVCMVTVRNDKWKSYSYHIGTTILKDFLTRTCYCSITHFSHDQGLLTSRWTSSPEHLQPYSPGQMPTSSGVGWLFLYSTQYEIRKSCNRLITHCSKFRLHN